jgi:AbrB family looped-hinge helix DNA binding protein
MVTVVHMSEKGQLVVPREIRAKHGFENGSAFSVFETKSGQVVFRPVKLKPKLSLIDHLRKFKGIEIPERHHFCPPRV